MGPHGSAYTTASSKVSTRNSRGIGTSGCRVQGTRTAVNKVKSIKMTLKQRFRNWVLNQNDDAIEYEKPTRESEERFHSDGMKLQVYKGSGGFVVEVRNYDRKRDENNNKMYIIHDDKDLGEELGKIITMESMR
jgi:hypothetical protein